MEGTVLSIRNLSYAGSEEALHGVSLRFERGETCSLLGLRHSGQEIFGRIMTGDVVTEFEPGIVEMDGKMVRSSAELQKSSYMISPNRISVSDWTVAEYIGLGTAKWILTHKERVNMRKETTRLFEKYDLPLNPESRINTLSSAELLSVELMRAYVTNVALIFVEGLEKLSDGELYTFRKLLKKILGRDRSCVIISYSTRVAKAIADRCYVFRNGYIVRLLGERGRFMLESERIILSNALEREALKLEGYVRVTPDAHNIIYRITSDSILGSRSWEFCKGEITGIVVHEYERRKLLFSVLAGLNTDIKADRELNGEKLVAHTADKLVKQGIVGIENVGSSRNIYSNMSIIDNLVLPSIVKLNQAEYISEQSGFTEMLQMEFDNIFGEIDLRQPLSSIGRRDRLYVAMLRWIIFKPRVMVLLDPMRMVDVYEKSIISSYIKRYANQGSSVIILTSGIEDIGIDVDRMIDGNLGVI